MSFVMISREYRKYAPYSTAAAPLGGVNSGREISVRTTLCKRSATFGEEVWLRRFKRTVSARNSNECTIPRRIQSQYEATGIVRLLKDRRSGEAGTHPYRKDEGAYRRAAVKGAKVESRLAG